MPDKKVKKYRIEGNSFNGKEVFRKNSTAEIRGKGKYDKKKETIFSFNFAVNEERCYERERVRNRKDSRVTL